MQTLIWKLDDYNPAKRKYKIKKENALSNVKTFYRDRGNIIIGFNNGKKYALDKFIFNESEKDALEFLLENRIKERFQKEKN